MSGISKHPEKPSKVTKDRVTQLLQQDITDCGKLARNICVFSGSKDILIKSAKKMANQEAAMENTLSNLRQIDKLLERAMDLANTTGHKMEETTIIRNQIQTLTALQ